MSSTTRQRLIEVAGSLFYQHGFQAVGLDRVLDEVGISKTALYKHFDSKDDLIIAVLNERDLHNIAEASAFMRTHGGSDPRRQIVAFFDQLEEWFARPDFRGCLFMNAATEFPSPNDPIHKAAEAHGRHLASEIHSRVVAAALRDPDAVTSQIMLLMTGAIAARHTGGVLDAAASAKRTVEMILGLASSHVA